MNNDPLKATREAWENAINPFRRKREELNEFEEKKELLGLSSKHSIDLVKEIKKTEEEIYRESLAGSYEKVEHRFLIQSTLNQEEVYNIIKKVFSQQNKKIKKEKEYEKIVFIKGSIWTSGKILTEVTISNLGRGFNIQVISRRSMMSEPFTIAEVKQLKGEFMKIEEDLRVFL